MPLSYWEQQWVHVTRCLLGVKAPTRRGGMCRRRSFLTRTRSTLQEAVQVYGLPDAETDTYARGAQTLKGDGDDILLLTD